MDFAKRQLQKYGWTEGKGLGKNESGIASALKPKLKYDTSGVGHEIGKELTRNWWENVYNNASKNINVVSNNNEVRMERLGDEVEISTKDYSVRDFKKAGNSMEYGSFIRTAKLTTGGTVKYENVPPISEAAALTFQPLTDDELFAACGGRTAHKAARHGLKLTGKLSRIQKQEKMLRKKLEAIHVADEPMEDLSAKKLHKLKKMQHVLHTASTDNYLSKKSKRRKKKQSVSFNETVIEIGPPNEGGNDSLQSTSSGKSVDSKVDIIELPINDRVGNESPPDDEGIEQDFDSPLKDPGLASFTQMQETRKDKGKKKRNSHAEFRLETWVGGGSASTITDVNYEVRKRRTETFQDVDNVRKIKKRYRDKEVNELSDGFEDCRISD